MAEINAQGLLDRLILDKETINHIKALIKSIDPDKVKAILELIEVDDDGWLRLKIDLGIKK